VARRATNGVPNHEQSAEQHALTDDASLTVVSAQVFNLDRGALKHERGVSEGHSAILERVITLFRIEGNAHSYCSYNNR
jgi:hypothetical protein